MYAGATMWLGSPTPGGTDGNGRETCGWEGRMAGPGIQ